MSTTHSQSSLVETLSKNVAILDSKNLQKLVPALFCCFGVMAFWIDLPVAIFFKENRLPGFFRDLFNNLEPFGHGIGVFFILLTVFVLDPKRRNALPRMAAASWGAGMMANLFKLMIARTRPRKLDFEGIDIWDSFGAFFPIFYAEDLSQSLPSAHTTTAFGLAVALAYYYPRGFFLFMAMAAGVGFQRVMSSAHFPSDVFFGAALGWSFAFLLFHHKRCQSFFSRWESNEIEST